MRVGLYDVLDVSTSRRRSPNFSELPHLTGLFPPQTLENDANEDLMTQLKVFTDHKEEDYDEFIHRFDNVRLELDDVNDCFEVVKNMVMDTPAEPYLLSILQHLLFIRDDALIR